MNNFQKRFNNYKTPQGLTLDLEENEFIVVDGFDFQPDNFVSLIVCITDRRFVFKETKLGLAPGGLTYEKLEKADVTISGSGDAEVTVSDDLDVKITGSGDVYYKGNPDLDVNITGSGEVINAN